MAQKTDFEKFFSDGEWDTLLEQTEVPLEAMQRPPDERPSWDRIAAWLVYSEMRRSGRAGPRQPDLFA